MPGRPAIIRKKGKVDAVKEVVLGALGAGRIGKLHADNILAMPGVRLKLIADPYIDEDWARTLGLSTTLDPAELFSDPEIAAVLIFSPSNLHAEQIITAAEAGKHIFCEKPIALDPDRIRQALLAVETAGVKLQVGFNRRFDPDIKRVKQAVDDGEIGQMQLIRITSRDPAPPPMDYLRISGGIFLDMTVHDFDLVRFLSGSEVDEVYAAGAVMVDPAIGEIGDIDTAVTTMKLSNGALAVIDNSRQAAYGYDQRIEVFGSLGSISAVNLTATRTVLTTAQGVVTDKPLHFFLERYHRSFRVEIEQFIRSIRDDTPPPVVGRDGLNAILIGLAAQASLERGAPVRVSEFAGDDPS